MFKAITALTFIYITISIANGSGFPGQINLRISVYHYPPFCIIRQGPNGTVQYSGFQIEILEWLGRALHANMVYVPLRPEALKTLGLYQATIKQLLDDEVDIANSLIYPTIDRASYIDFTNPIISTKYTMMLPYPRENNRLGAVIRPFTEEVWLLLFVTFFVAAITITLSSWRSDAEINLHKSFNYVYTVLTNQGDYLPRRSGVMTQLVAGLWCLIMLVLANAYSGCLTSFMAAQKFETLPKSLGDFVAMKRYKISMEKNTLLTGLFLNATSGNYKVIGDMLRQHPNLIINTNQSVAIASVLEHNAAFVTGEEFTKIMIYSDMKKTGRCRLTISDFMTVSQSYLRFGLQKDGRYNELINKKIWHVWEFGLKSIWGAPFMNPIDKCIVKDKKVTAREKVIPLSLRELLSVFFILGLGFTVSVIVLTIERVYYKFAKPKAIQKA